ncbi:hypothetical protein SUGI_0126560 [Cryptomeria japonica]|uniref:protein TIFY 11d-like n=1 Tax=Cryptomeria japonica TaxID=3369 RepID=UPI002408DCF6|nr:protein TIFY 11d-like [Cryptomeria japonica]GLJ10345.1 hypothetical protein SUGI_0126560 [Cryptomeria japonica]
MALLAVENAKKNNESKVKQDFNPFTKYFEVKESLISLKDGGITSGFQHKEADAYPVSSPAESTITDKQSSGTAQMTIFYNGMVNIYDTIPLDKAQAIMLLASSGNKSFPKMIHNQPIPRGPYFPLVRKHSVQSFLEKRKNRWIPKTPYAKEEKPKLNLCPTAS